MFCGTPSGGPFSSFGYQQLLNEAALFDFEGRGRLMVQSLCEDE